MLETHQRKYFLLVHGLRKKRPVERPRQSKALVENYLAVGLNLPVGNDCTLAVFSIRVSRFDYFDVYNQRFPIQESRKGLKKEIIDG